MFLLSALLSSHAVVSAQEEYTFDLSEVEEEFEKRPYELGGYAEFRPILYGLDRDSAFYRLRTRSSGHQKTLDEYNLSLLLDAGYEKDWVRFSLRSRSDMKESSLESSKKTELFEGYASFSTGPSLTFDLGKKTLKWGKGYAWNPVAFLDRPKDPNDPDLALEGYWVAAMDYVKSFQGPLQTFAFNPVLLPVEGEMNDEFGRSHHLNLAARWYFLYRDTDLDLMFLTGESRADRFGLDFSRNIVSNFEIHGEFALIDDFTRTWTDREGALSRRTEDVKRYLLGIRYLSPYDTTFIAEYYRNGTGFSETEMENFFTLVDSGYDRFLSTGDKSLLNRALAFSRKDYGRRNPMKDYFYLRISQKEPLDILYFTPSLTWIYNIDDRSFSLFADITYTRITNLEVRLKGGVLSGEESTEYGEKQNDYRIELRLRYYFDVMEWL